ncbi:molybdopterin molybdotransferase MoeA [Histophilus somni]|uniref:Molybdopterin molybdenumtransferase n=1 Tax=Histophilus somni TaxID=731 RepID=A0AAX2S4Z8_HISSO|nr:molybdopterin molybdotransferase MoeA [Histophilus somni]QEH08877.1 molybdopterin molybdotransferase MoeA [Histophilus somni]QEH12541.1 molybdopterin molybdotransferase MoeA [Histophilus somni]QEH25149.1 molybdopterin molybdotransferase MoeA [Histophilus somni]QEH27023.1 molybdopterin molybdotransferase MoeA [Histophilus somni]QEH51217.1 molybdopterin molybdotransferase MoeA [Histophilus somni]
MLSLEQALQQMLSQLATINKTETLSLQQAVARICAEDIISPINVPSFDNSAMDGYAVRLADLKHSTTLSICGKSFAGNPFNEQWQEKSVIRIMTGAMIPEGTDAVVMQENVTINEDGTVTINEIPKLHQNIRRLGEDIKVGDIALKMGSKLTALSLPLLASLGISHVKVYKKPKVALFSTGDELVSVGQPLAQGKIYDSNRFTIRLMLEKFPCDILDFGILPDDEQLFEQTFFKAQKQADLVISSGGVSVGEADFTKAVLEKCGEINFWKIAMKPGKPFAFGKLNNAWFCGLPGNPVSALVTFYQLVQPVIAKLSGYTQWKMPQQLKAISATKLKKSIGRTDFQRGFYQLNTQGQIEVYPVGQQGSHLFSAFVNSNCFIRLEQERGNVNAGDIVTIEPFSDILN